MYVNSYTYEPVIAELLAITLLLLRSYVIAVIARTYEPVMAEIIVEIIGLSSAILL